MRCQRVLSLRGIEGAIVEQTVYKTLPCNGHAAWEG